MAKIKTPLSKTSSKAKPRSSSVRDLKPKTKKPSFTVQMLKEDAPTVEPLIDDIENDENDFTKVDIDYRPEHYDPLPAYESSRQPAMRVAPVSDEPDDDDFEDDIEAVLEDLPPKDIIRVRFGTFVQLVKNHDMNEVIEKNADQEIVMSSNLLTELAGSKDQNEEKKIPLVFLVGIAIGVVLTYIFFST